jgi:hypothetical protein
MKRGLMEAEATEDVEGKKSMQRQRMLQMMHAQEEQEEEQRRQEQVEQLQLQMQQQEQELQKEQQKQAEPELTKEQIAMIQIEAEELARKELLMEGVLKPEVDCELDPCYEGCPWSNHPERCLPQAKIDCAQDHCGAGCPDSSDHKKCPTILHHATSSLSVADVAAIVNRHNEVRRMLGLTLVEWDLSLSEGAQTWANMCDFSHSKADVREQFFRNLKPKNTLKYTVGENLLAGEPSQSSTLSVDGIIAQGLQWDCKRNFCKNPNGGCGSFRQAFHQDTTRIGCGFKLCQHSSPFGNNTSAWNNLVCWYNPKTSYAERPFSRSLCSALDLGKFFPKNAAERAQSKEKAFLEMITEQFLEEHPHVKF